jgi:hypothetical protein
MPEGTRGGGHASGPPFQGAGLTASPARPEA